MKTIKISNFKDIPKNYTGIVEYPGGTKRWYLNGKRHRVDGPTIEYVDGTKKWCLDDKLHRTDGPAVEYPDGRKYWFLNGELLDENKINQFVDELDYPIKVAIKLVYLLEMNES